MTDTETKDRIAALETMLEMAIAQRNESNNAVLQLAAQIKLKDQEIASLKEEQTLVKTDEQPVLQ